MWTAAVSLLSKTLLKSVIGAYTLCERMVSRGNFVASIFRGLLRENTRVFKTVELISQSWLHVFMLGSFVLSSALESPLHDLL